MWLAYLVDRRGSFAEKVRDRGTSYRGSTEGVG